MNLVLIKGDLPVHCIASDISGEWEFYMSKEESKIQPSCGHNQPDQNTGTSINNNTYAKTTYFHMMMKLTWKTN